VKGGLEFREAKCIKQMGDSVVLVVSGKGTRSEINGKEGGNIGGKGRMVGTGNGYSRGRIEG